LFHDPPARGTWNMALDEALLLQAAEGGPPTLRLYGWEQPTLSLGYFQRNADRQLHRPSLPCAAVRRTTGGGAILHDRELTYSCALPSGHRLARRAEDLYYAIHKSIVLALAQLGFIARLQSCGPSASTPARNAASNHGCSATQSISVAKSAEMPPQPFLCFQRRTAGDVVLGEQKIAGSAQRRCRGAVLQHGSILLARSEYAPELRGIGDLQSRPIAAGELSDALLQALCAPLQAVFVPAHLSRETLDRVAAIEATKFAAGSWLRQR
jgi:lipoate-protein ligase A